MELKEYQIEASRRLDVWLEELHKQQLDAVEAAKAPRGDRQAEAREDLGVPAKTWQALCDRGELPKGVKGRGCRYVHRTTNAGEPLPHVCLKIPTGGGKTLLGAVSVERILAHRDVQTGLVLWIVPSNAIYEQTWNALRTRDHPYRERLDRACGGRVKLLQKDDAFSLDDLRNHLCVMLLMLPATWREKNKRSLRMFRDSGRYHSFFPEEGNAKAQKNHASLHPHLERHPETDRVMRSLSNVFKMSRPIVILDEAHKAYSKNKANAQEYARKISRMDPSVVIELSATPSHDISNVLVDVNGTELHDEEMIKLPIEVLTRSDANPWQATLNDARERLDELACAAEKHEAETGKYIRPIAVVRCENTGKSKRDGNNIHVEDVREELIAQGVHPDEIKVKSSENDELGREDLMNPNERSRVRWILTKDALKEGWDCPFAYVLVLLDHTKAKTAVTQMVGRVLRMPYVEFTQSDPLDRCYVFCHDVNVHKSVDFVRHGLENEGMADLTKWVDGGDQGANLKKVEFKRRKPHRGADIYLPKVLTCGDDGERRDLDYRRDILADIDWSELGIRDTQPIMIPPTTGGSATVHVREEEDTNIADLNFEVSDEIDLVYFSKHFAQIIPNPWVCASLAGRALDALMAVGKQSARSINLRRSSYAEAWRRDLFKQIDCLAYKVFVDKLNSGVIAFNLEALEGNYEFVETFEEVIPERAMPLGGGYANPIQRSLFEPTDAESNYNNLERDFAYYTDGQAAVSWWHRVAASQRSGYFVRGWRRNKVFPDFVVKAVDPESLPDHPSTQLMLFETKGSHLRDNDDSRYKETLFEILQLAYNGVPAAKGKVVIYNGEPKGVFKMVIEDQIEQAFEGTVVAKPLRPTDQPQASQP